MFEIVLLDWQQSEKLTKINPWSGMLIACVVSL
jgi:hypothetical protein